MAVLEHIKLSSVLSSVSPVNPVNLIFILSISLSSQHKMHAKILLALLPALAAAACKGPAVNENTLNLLKSFEKLVPNPYDDGYGNPTIGYGHLCKDKSCSDVTFPKPLSDADATKLLAGDLVVSPNTHRTSYTTQRSRILIQTAIPRRPDQRPGRPRHPQRQPVRCSGRLDLQHRQRQHGQVGPCQAYEQGRGRRQSG